MYYIADSKIHGKGSFASKFIEKNTIVASKPFIIIKYSLRLVNDPISKYWWSGKQFGIFFNKLLVNGLGCYCNHSEINKNLKVIYNKKTNSFDFITIKDINKDEELLINYGKNYKRK